MWRNDLAFCGGSMLKIKTACEYGVIFDVKVARHNMLRLTDGRELFSPTHAFSGYFQVQTTLVMRAFATRVFAYLQLCFSIMTNISILSAER
jgi:hypothetical protein